jgi:hypothetical protein
LGRVGSIGGIRIKNRALLAGYTLSMLMAQFVLEWLPYLGVDPDGRRVAGPDQSLAQLNL